MVQQKLFNDAEMSPVEQEVVRNEVLTFMRDHNAAEDQEFYPHGILNLTYRDEAGRPTRRKAKYWQVVAANHLLGKDADKPFDQRKASLLLAHEMGTGKTISAILGLAGVYRQMSWWRASVGKRNPTTNKFEMPPQKKTVIIVPTGVLLKWEAEVRAWTTLGDRLLVTNKVEELTKAAIDAALVLIVTPEALRTAFKTFTYDSDNPDEKKSKQSNKLMRTRIQRKKGAEGKLVAAHPVCVMLNNGLALLVVDELHTMYNPSRWIGYIVGLFAGRANYRLGLSGTAITNGPWQLAWAARSLDARSPNLDNQLELHEERFYADGLVVNRESVEAWNQHLVDRVDARFLEDQITVQKKVTVLKYDPFVGHVNRDGTVNEYAIAEHNAQVSASHLDAPERVSWTHKVKTPPQGLKFKATIALGHYAFNAYLGAAGGVTDGLKIKKTAKSDPTWDDVKIGKAAESPSQAMRLILRLIQSRQAAGHARVAVFCESVGELMILDRYFQDLGGPVGEVYLYTGGQTPHEKDRKIKRFLTCPKGVFLFSSAGGIGIDLQKGCEVMLSVGSVPWTPSDLDQAFARIYRIGQTKDVEIIQLVARRGVDEVIMSLHEDKRRLAAAAIDGDFEAFAGENPEWRAHATIMSQCVKLDPSGNYELTDDQQSRLRDYAVMAAESAAAGGPPPPSAGLSVPPQAAVPPSRMRLPPVAFPLTAA